MSIRRGDDGYWNDSRGDDAGRLCARGKHCASRDENGIPSWGPRAFCEADRGHIRNVLGKGQLPALYRELGARIGDKSVRGDALRVTGGARTPPVPLNLGVDALMRQTVAVVTSWDERVRTVVRLTEPDTLTSRRIDQRSVFTDACATLAAHIDTLLGLQPDAMMRSMDLSRREYLPEDTHAMVHVSGEWISYTVDLSGADAGVEVLNLYHRCLGMLGYRPQHVLLRSRCWDCDASGKLVRYDGTAGLAEHVSCQACRVEYVGQRLVLLMAAEERIEREIAEGRKAS